MKRVILGVLALIFSIVVVIGGYILITSRSLQKYAVEENVSCPYSWKELRSGIYRLEIDATAYPDYSWGVECYPKNVVAVAEEDSKAGTVAFSILPLNMGQTYVQVYCEQTDPFTVRVFEIGMQIRVSEDHEITVETTEQKDYSGVSALGEDGEYPAQWWTSSGGRINLLITGEGNSWQAVDYDPDSMDVVGPFYRQGSCGFEIQGKLAGTFPLTIYDGRDKAINLEVEVAEDLSAAITTFAVEPYILDRSEEHTALEAVAGRTVALLPEAIATDYFVSSNGGVISFLLKDREWNWQIATNSSEEALLEDLPAKATETKTATAHGMTLSAYRYKSGVVVSWTDGNCVMVLGGETEAALTDALAVAGQIVEENHGQ